MVETIKCNFEPVLTISHHDGNFICLCFILKNSNLIELTEDHYIYVYRDGYLLKILAKNVKIGDLFPIKSNNEYINYSEIIDIKMTPSSFVSNIRTMSGIILVNNIISSCNVKGDFGELGQKILNFAYYINAELPQKIKNFSLLMLLQAIQSSLLLH